MDDSAAFLQHGRMVRPLKCLLDQFGELSGLFTQIKKCVVISAATVAPRATSLGSFPVLPETGRTRYLGILIGLGDVRDANWDARVAAIQARLGVASIVSNGVPSRIAIVRAVVIPAILFTAAHVTPSAAHRQRLHRLIKVYVVRGSMGADGAVRWPTDRGQLQASRDMGGLGLPDLDDALLALALRQAWDWTHMPPSKGRAALANVLAAGPHRADLTPTATVLHWQAALNKPMHPVELGLHIGRCVMYACFPVSERRTSLVALWLAPDRTPAVWWMGQTTADFWLPLQWRVAWGDFCGERDRSMPPELRAFWLTFSWAQNAWLCDASGRQFKVSHWRQYRDCLLAAFRVEYVAPGHVRVHLPQHIKRPSQRVLRRFELWLWAVVVQSPTTDNAWRVVDVPAALVGFQWRATTGARILGWRVDGVDVPPATVVLQVANGVGVCVATEGATGALQAGDQLRIRAHPAWTPAPLLEADQGMPNDKRHHLPHRLKIGRRRLGRLFMGLRRHKRPPTAARLNRLRGSYKTMALHLQQTTWTKVWAARGVLGPHHTFFWWRLTTGTLRLYHPRWVPTRACNMDRDCQLTQDSVRHTLWDCPVARAVWAHLWSWWTGVDVRPGDLDQQHEAAVFQRMAPSMPGWLAREYTAQFDEDAEQLWDIWSQMWWAVATLGAHSLWRTRWQCLETGTTRPRGVVVQAVRRSIRDHFAGVATSMRRRPATRVAGILMERILVLTDRQPCRPGAAVRAYQLTFDGGARRKGASGGGWTLSKDGQVVACGWQTYPKGSTNNYAEASALLAGLTHLSTLDPTKACAVHLRGDSTLILRQITGLWTVRHPVLRPLIHAIRTELVGYVHSTQHVRRAWNTAADWLANLAMDTATSTVLTWNPSRPRRELLRVCGLLRHDNNPDMTYANIRTPLVRATQLTVKRIYEQKRVDSVSTA